LKVGEPEGPITGGVAVTGLDSSYSRKVEREVEARVATKHAPAVSKVKVVEADADKLIRKATELSAALQLKT
jgi:hypothetical protein